MLWLFPAAFLFLLGAVPLILLLNSLRPRGPRVPVTALFLLEKVLRERPMGRRLGWLWRRNLPLILQLLAAAAVIAALAGPALLGVGGAGRDLVVVMDLSASMKAAGESGTRFAAARAELRRRIAALGANDRMMIIGAGAAPEVLQPFTGDRARLGQVAEGLSATDTEAPVKEAVLLAHTFLKRRGPHRVVVITDGAFEGIEELPLGASYIELAQVRGGADNVGILGFQFRRVAGEADEYEAMVVVQNFTERPVHAPLIVTVADRVVSRALLTLRPFAREVLIYGIPGPLHGRATALLAVDDDLDTDNRAYLAFPDERPTRVLYVGPGNPFLERLLRYFPHVTVARIDRIPVDRVTEQVAAYDVVMLDRVPAPPLTRGNFILIRTVAEGLPLRAAGRIPRPALVSADTEHPLAAGVRLDRLYVRDALELVPEGGGVSLAESERGPLDPRGGDGRPQGVGFRVRPDPVGPAVPGVLSAPGAQRFLLVPAHGPGVPRQPGSRGAALRGGRGRGRGGAGVRQPLRPEQPGAYPGARRHLLRHGGGRLLPVPGKTRGKASSR